MNSQGNLVEKNTHAQSANAKNFAYKRGLVVKFASRLTVITQKGHSRPPPERVLWSARSHRVLALFLVSHLVA